SCGWPPTSSAPRPPPSAWRSGRGAGGGGRLRPVSPASGGRAGGWVGLAERQALVGGGLLALILLVSVGLSVVMARSMARSLRVLRIAAHKVARRTLPDTVERLQRVSHGDDPTLPLVQSAPLEVRSRDEV